MTNKQAEPADCIFDEFDRLGISTNQDPCSGLMTREPNCFIELEPETALVDVYDDHVNGIYRAIPLLEYLKELGSEEIDLDAIWPAIAQFEAP